MTDHNMFHVYCNGFEKVLNSISETQAFVNQLRGMGCVGKEIVVTQGRGNGKAVTFGVGRKVRREILKAA